MNAFARFFTLFGAWFQIALFPVLISLILSLIIYLTMPAMIGFMLCVLVCAGGVITGVIMATRIFLKRGAASFLPKPEEIQAEQEQENSET